MTITAIYENGVLRPLQDIHFKERQKVRIILEPDFSWHSALKNLLRQVHRRAAKFSSAEIEKDISYASRKARRNN